MPTFEELLEEYKARGPLTLERINGAGSYFISVFKGFSDEGYPLSEEGGDAFYVALQVLAHFASAYKEKSNEL